MSAHNKTAHGSAGGGHGPRGMMPGEKAKDFKGTMYRMFKYLGRFLPAIVVGLLFAAASTVLMINGPKILANATDELFNGLIAQLTGTGGIDFGRLARILLFLGGVYLCSAVLSGIQAWIMSGISTRLSYTLRRDLSQKINRLPLSYFDRVQSGDVLSRITNDVDTLGQSLNQSVTQLITSVTQVVGVLVMMLSISLPLTGVTVLTLPASLLIVGVVVHFSQRYFREQQQVLGTVNGIVEEDFAGQGVIQVFDRADSAVEAFERQNDRLFTSA